VSTEAWSWFNVAWLFGASLLATVGIVLLVEKIKRRFFRDQ
jgi:hypothetical protein